MTRLTGAQTNDDLRLLKDWLCANRLSLNVDKTKYMLMTKRNDDRDLDIYFNDRLINRVEQHKFLGIIIDSKLKFDKQINNLSVKLSRTVGIMRRLHYYIPDHVLRNLFYSLFYSHLVYAITVYGSSCPTALDRIDRLTNTAIRLMSHHEDHNVRDIYSMYKIMNFDNTYKYCSSVKMYQILKQGTHVYFLNLIENEHVDHAHGTRFTENNNLILPFYNKTKTQRSFLYKGISNWNCLPTEIRNINNIVKFKKVLKQYFTC